MMFLKLNNMQIKNTNHIRSKHTVFDFYKYAYMKHIIGNLGSKYL